MFQVMTLGIKSLSKGCLDGGGARYQAKCVEKFPAKQIQNKNPRKPYEASQDRSTPRPVRFFLTEAGGGRATEYDS